MYRVLLVYNAGKKSQKLKK